MGLIGGPSPQNHFLLGAIGALDPIKCQVRPLPHGVPPDADRESLAQGARNARRVVLGVPGGFPARSQTWNPPQSAGRKIVFQEPPTSFHGGGLDGKPRVTRVLLQESRVFFAQPVFTKVTSEHAVRVNSCLQRHQALAKRFASMNPDLCCGLKAFIVGHVQPKQQRQAKK